MYLTDEVAPPKTLCQKFGLRPVFALLRVESPALQPGLAIVRLALAADAAAPLRDSCPRSTSPIAALVPRRVSTAARRSARWRVWSDGAVSMNAIHTISTLGVRHGWDKLGHDRHRR